MSQCVCPEQARPKRRGGGKQVDQSHGALCPISTAHWSAHISLPQSDYFWIAGDPTATAVTDDDGVYRD
jgi:hypothetical protein